MMIPGAWEPRRLHAAVKASVRVPPVASISEPAYQRRNGMATWLEVSIVVAALVAAMLFAMWASRIEARVVMRNGHAPHSPLELRP
jgi:hypothetical protein